MGIVAFCPNGHRIKVKDDLAGKKGICPTCEAKFRIPRKSASPSPAGGGLATARVVSLDPHYAATLAAARRIDEDDTSGPGEQGMEQADAAPDFVLLADEPERGEPPVEPVAPVAPPATAPAADAAAPRPHAALEERPELTWSVAVRGGAPSAPMDVAAMRAWLDSAAATPDHVVWRADWPDWRSLGDVFPEALSPPPPRWP